MKLHKTATNIKNQHYVQPASTNILFLCTLKSTSLCKISLCVSSGVCRCTPLPFSIPLPQRATHTHTKLKVVINKNLERRLIHNLDIPFPFFYWGAGAPETPSPTYTGVDFNDIPSPLVNPGSTHDILVYFFL